MDRACKDFFRRIPELFAIPERHVVAGVDFEGFLKALLRVCLVPGEHIRNSDNAMQRI